MPSGTIRAIMDNRYQLSYFSKFRRSSIRPANSPYTRRHLEKVAHAACLKPAQRVLEVGAGMGRFSLLLDEQDCDVVASDLSQELLAKLSLADPQGRVRTLVTDIAEISRHTDERFDRAVGFFMLHHLTNLNAAFRGLSAVLNPGARVAFCEPNAYNPLFYFQIAVTPGMTWKGDGGIVRMRPSVLFDAMSGAGFSDLRIERYGFFPPFLANTRSGSALEKRLESIGILEPVRAFQIISGRRC